MSFDRQRLKEAFSIQRNFRALVNRPKNHLPSLDGLRALSILGIFAYHWIWCAQLFIANTYEQYLQYPIYIKWIERGETFVDLFFVISGFLIGCMLIREYQEHERLNLKSFFVNRFLRLMPVYYFALGMTVIGLMLEPGPDNIFGTPVKSNIEYVWANLLYVNNFLDPRNQFFGHSWSLAVEEQFYFIFPFALLGFYRFKLHRHPWKTTWAIVALYALIRIGAQLYALSTMGQACGASVDQSLAELEKNHLTSFVSELNYCLGLYQWDYVYDNMYTKFVTLFAGVWAAYVHITCPEKVQRFFSRTGLALLGALFSISGFVMGFVDLFVIQDAMWLRIYRSCFSQTFFGFGLAYLILFCLYGKGALAAGLNRFLSLRVFYPIAQLAYSLYIFHIVVIMGVYQIVMISNPELSLTELIESTAALTLALSFFVSVLTYIFIEKPFMNIRKR